MVMSQSASSPHDGKTMFEHVVMVILKQPMDGPLSKALARGGIHTVTDVLTLSQSGCDAPTYHDAYGTVRPLAIGHKNLLQMLKIYGAHCKAEGSPIVDWMTITKRDFDDFRHSQAGLHASEWDNTIAPATISVVLPKSSSSTVSITTSASPPVAISIMTSASSSSEVSVTASKSSSSTVLVATSRRSSSMVSIVTARSSSSTMPVTTFESSSNSGEDQDVSMYPNGKAALHHVL